MAGTCSYPYPSFQQMAEAAGNLVTYLRGGSGVDLNCALHCAGCVSMYGLSVAFPDGGMVAAAAAASSAPPLDKQAFATALEGVAKGNEAGMKAIDWKALILQAIQLILALLLKQPA